MIGKAYLKRKVFGNSPEDIEGYEEAINSTEMYVPHHVLEWKYSVEELKAMGHYDKVSPDELIWMPESVHNSNPVLHKGIREFHTSLKTKMKGNKNSKGKTSWCKGKKLNEDQLKNHCKGRIGKSYSEFGNKFKKHYGFSRNENVELYKYEYRYYAKHGHVCRWEEL